MSVSKESCIPVTTLLAEGALLVEASLLQPSEELEIASPRRTDAAGLLNEKPKA
jgi:hypothetical protein